MKTFFRISVLLIFGFVPFFASGVSTTFYLTVENDGNSSHSTSGYLQLHDESGGSSFSSANVPLYVNLQPHTTTVVTFVVPGAADDWNRITDSHGNIIDVSPHHYHFLLYDDCVQALPVSSLITSPAPGSLPQLTFFGEIYIDDNCDQIPAQMTNYVFCANNNSLGVPATATWTFNGVVVKQESLSPGASDCWTSPDIEYSPYPQNFSENTSVVAAQLGTQAGAPLPDGTPTLEFATNPVANASSFGDGLNGITNSSLNGGGTVTNIGGTNFVSNPDQQPQVAPTNLLTFPTPSGLATESTLEAGFNTMHQDLQTIQSQEKLNGDSLSSGIGVVTNQLGDISRNTALFTNLSSLTNLQVSSSNTFNISSNITIGNFPSNYPDLNAEQTQIGISNLLSGDTNEADLDTNFISSNNIVYNVQTSDTNSDAAISAAQTALGTPLVTLMSSASNQVGSYLGQTIPTGEEPDFTISIPFTGVTMDLNPVTQFPWFFEFTHLLMTWICVVAFVTGCLSMLNDILDKYAAAQTGHVPNMTGGGGGSAGGTPMTPI